MRNVDNSEKPIELDAACKPLLARERSAMQDISGASVVRLQRPPQEVMTPIRLGCAHQTRLSFARSLIRRMARQGWKIECSRFDVDLRNVGEAIYTIDTPHGRYSFVAFAHHIEAHERTDRAIAEHWDYTFALRDGAVDEHALSHLREQVPRQDRGRYSAEDLVFSRANKSGRLFDRVMDRLASGRQPEPRWFDDVGYLIRTTAVFANGLNGIADYERLRQGGALPHPFAAQMLIVYLIREFSLDLVDHLAHRRSPGTAVPLSRSLRRYCGVGNATGLGMAPFLINHPRLVHQWILVRERALAQVKAQPRTTARHSARFMALLERSIRHVDSWATEDPAQSQRLKEMRTELRALHEHLLSDSERHWSSRRRPWRALADHVHANYSMETGELVNSLILEPHGDLVDCSEDEMIVQEAAPAFVPQMSLNALKSEIEESYEWAIGLSFDEPSATYYFWYRSEQKAEPRLGVRGEDRGADRALSMSVALDVHRLYRRLLDLTADQLGEPVGAYVARHPEYRATVARVQTIRTCPYGEVRANALDKDFVPIDLLRAKLALFGATKFDPKSDRWVRIALMQGAPPRTELGGPPEAVDDWFCATCGVEQ